MPQVKKYTKHRYIKPLIEVTPDEYMRFRILCLQAGTTMTGWFKGVLHEHLKRLPSLPDTHYGPHRVDHGKPRPTRRKKRTLSSQKKSVKSKVKAGTKPKKALAVKEA